MTRSLAVEWARYKIRFNAIAPARFPRKVLGRGCCLRKNSKTARKIIIR